MSPEQEVLADLFDQLARIETNVGDARAVLGEWPTELAAFEALPPLARIASTALIKDFEQLLDTLVRVIRTELRMTGHRLKGMTPLDVANKAEDLGQIADGRALFALIELRNELAHEYPDDAAVRFQRTTAAFAGLPLLADGIQRVRNFAATRLQGQTP